MSSGRGIRRLARGAIYGFASAGLVASCPSLSWGAIPRELQCPGCNVIFVTIDVLRSDELKIGGSTKSIMPNLDALAARGISFTNAYSPSPDTLPATFTFMSGLEPWHHGVQLQLRDDLRQAEWLRRGRTLPAILKREGYEVYRTAFSTAILSQLAEKQYRGSRSVEVRNLEGIGKFFLWIQETVHDPYYPRPETVRSLDVTLSKTSYPDREIVSRCLFASLAGGVWPDSLNNKGYSVAKDSPDRERAQRLVAIADPRERLAAFKSYDPEADWYALRSHCFWSFFSSETISVARLLYDARAQEVDDDLQEAFRVLEAKGFLSHSLIVITSQHGEEFLEHGEVVHSRQLYGESLHIPLVIFFPGLKDGRIIGQVVRGVDLMPTILQAVGIRPPRGLDGESLLPCLAGRCRERTAFACWNHACSARDGRFTYLRREVWPHGFAEQLFDRQTDPQEQKDISLAEPKTTARMRAILSRQLLRNSEQGQSGRSWSAEAQEKAKDVISRWEDW